MCNDNTKLHLKNVSFTRILFVNNVTRVVEYILRNLMNIFEPMLNSADMLFCNIVGNCLKS